MGILHGGWRRHGSTIVLDLPPEPEFELESPEPQGWLLALACGDWIPATDADVARDGTQPRYMELLGYTPGTEVRETHNGRLWKLRVVSKWTDPGLTTFEKDVRGWLCSNPPMIASRPATALRGGPFAFGGPEFLPMGAAGLDMPDRLCDGQTTVPFYIPVSGTRSLKVTFTASARAESCPAMVLLRLRSTSAPDTDLKTFVLYLARFVDNTQTEARNIDLPLGSYSFKVNYAPDSSCCIEKPRIQVEWSSQQVVESNDW
jgi:hypothetical protein